MATRDPGPPMNSSPLTQAMVDAMAAAARAAESAAQSAQSAAQAAQSSSTAIARVSVGRVDRDPDPGGRGQNWSGGPTESVVDPVRVRATRVGGSTAAGPTGGPFIPPGGHRPGQGGQSANQGYVQPPPPLQGAAFPGAFQNPFSHFGQQRAGASPPPIPGRTGAVPPPLPRTPPIPPIGTAAGGPAGGAGGTIGSVLQMAGRMGFGPGGGQVANIIGSLMGGGGGGGLGGLVGAAAGGGGGGIGGILGGLGGAGGAAGGAGGAMAGIAGAAGPIGLAIAAGKMVMDNMDEGNAMARRGIGQTIGSGLRGEATGVMKGAVNTYAGVASAAAGPVLGPVIRKMAGAVNAVIDQLDGLTQKFKGYNAAVAAAEGQFEAKQEMFNVKMGAALSPLLTAFSGLKTSVLGVVEKFTPLISFLAKMGGGVLNLISGLLDGFAKVVPIVIDHFKLVASTLVWASGQIYSTFKYLNPAAALVAEGLGIAPKDRTFKESRDHVDKLFADGSEKDQRGQMLAMFLGSIALARKDARGGGLVGSAAVGTNMIPGAQDKLAGVTAGKRQGQHSHDPRAQDASGFGGNRHLGMRDVELGNGNKMRDGHAKWRADKAAKEQADREAKERARNAGNKAADANAPVAPIMPSPNGILGDIRQTVAFNLDMKLATEREIFDMMERIRSHVTSGLMMARNEASLFRSMAMAQMPAL